MMRWDTFSPARNICDLAIAGMSKSLKFVIISFKHQSIIHRLWGQWFMNWSSYL